MNIFISGATGFIGAKLAQRLANQGHIIHALYRTSNKTTELVHPNIRLFKGDILDYGSLEAAIKDCEQVYHVAAFTEVWAKNKNRIYELNVKATCNILELALQSGVKKLVFTSTAGVLGPSVNGIVNEETTRSRDFFLEYERTKSIAEEKVKEYVDKGLHCVIVNPTRVYGPGLLSKSNSVTIMIKSFSEGKWRMIPGNGNSVGNYVFVENVVDGHMLAMEKGKSGQRYVLGGDNISYLEFFKTLRSLTNQKHWMIKLPLWIMLAVSYTMMLITNIFGIKPMITPALVRKFNYNWHVSSDKAIGELGYKPDKFPVGAQKTLDWIKNNLETGN
jgi:nucleoside-diphosphate-sugar epimerase